MNHLQSLEYKQLLINNVNYLLHQNNWNLRQLSEEADIPYETLKKLISGKISNPSFYNVIKIANAFHCPLDYLMSTDIANEPFLSNLPPRAYKLLKEIALFESHLATVSASTHQLLIPVITPSGLMYDGMVFDIISSGYVDISTYKSQYGDSIICGLKITSNVFHPIYNKDDILLIANDHPPAYGDTCIILYDNRVYIRIYFSGPSPVLMPINGLGSPIVVHNINDWHIFGRVVTVIRTSK